MTTDHGSAFIAADVRLLPADQGGRRSPIRSGYRCNCWIGHQDADGRAYNDATIHLVDSDLLAPGHAAAARIQPHDPDSWTQISVGSTIELCEGPRTIGIATVTELFPAGDS